MSAGRKVRVQPVRDLVGPEDQRRQAGAEDEAQGAQEPDLSTTGREFAVEHGAARVVRIVVDRHRRACREAAQDSGDGGAVARRIGDADPIAVEGASPVREGVGHRRDVETCVVAPDRFWCSMVNAELVICA